MTNVARLWVPHGTPRLRSVLRHFGWRHELLRVALVYLLYESIRVLPSLHVTNAAANGRSILGAERWLHLAPEPSLNAWLYGLPDGFAVAAAYYYEVLHYLVTPALLIWLFRRKTEAYHRARNSLVAMTLPSLVVFWLFPVVPPRLLGGAGFHDIVADQHQWGWWSAGGTAPNGLGGLVNEFAAMPSLHVGWALWCGVQLVRHARHRVVRALGAAYPLLTGLVVMATGNHYLADAVAGVAVAGLGGAAGWALTPRDTGWFWRSRQMPFRPETHQPDAARSGSSEVEERYWRPSPSRSAHCIRPGVPRRTRSHRQSWTCTINDRR